MKKEKTVKKIRIHYGDIPLVECMKKVIQNYKDKKPVS